VNKTELPPARDERLSSERHAPRVQSTLAGSEKAHRSTNVCSPALRICLSVLNAANLS